MADFKQIDKARKILGLAESATLSEIKQAYHKKARECHPDKHQGKGKIKQKELFQEVNSAKDLILEYCYNYKFSFTQSEVNRNSMDREFYQHMKQFYDGWWDNLNT